jgi:hypothetical protein
VYFKYLCDWVDLVAIYFNGVSIIIVITTYLLTAVEFSLGGSSPYTNTDKTKKNNFMEYITMCLDSTNKL